MIWYDMIWCDTAAYVLYIWPTYRILEISWGRSSNSRLASDAWPRLPTLLASDVEGCRPAPSEKTEAEDASTRPVKSTAGCERPQREWFQLFIIPAGMLVHKLRKSQQVTERTSWQPLNCKSIAASYDFFDLLARCAAR